MKKQLLRFLMFLMFVISNSVSVAGVIEDVISASLPQNVPEELKRELVEKWINSLTDEQQPQLRPLLAELEIQSYQDLLYIKTNVPGTQICSQLINCHGFHADEVAKYADAVLALRDKNQVATNALISNFIAIIGAILAVASFVISSITALRSKKTASV